MSNIISGLGNTATSLFGGTNVSPVDLNRLYGTAYSTLQGGNLSLDPTIRDIQNQALTGYTNLLPGLQPDITNRFSTAGLRGISSNLGDIASQLTGNRNAFIQARVDPLRQALAQQQGQLQRSLNRRGVFGTFGNQDMANLAFQGNRAIGDAQAQALQEALNAQTGILGQQAGIQGQILGAGAALTGAQQNQNAQYMNALNAISGLGQQRFAQELSGLGLSTNTINALLGLQQRAQLAQDQAGRQGVQNLANFTGGFLSGGL